MRKWYDRIQHAIRNGRYFFGDHADNMLRERGIMHWQVVEGFEHGHVLTIRPNARPNPIVETEQMLPDGTRFKAVWAFVRRLDHAKLVTVHFFDR